MAILTIIILHGFFFSSHTEEENGSSGRVLIEQEAPWHVEAIGQRGGAIALRIKNTDTGDSLLVKPEIPVGAVAESLHFREDWLIVLGSLGSLNCLVIFIELETGKTMFHIGWHPVISPTGVRVAVQRFHPRFMPKEFMRPAVEVITPRDTQAIRKVFPGDSWRIRDEKGRVFNFLDASSFAWDSSGQRLAFLARHGRIYEPETTDSWYLVIIDFEKPEVDRLTLSELDISKYLTPNRSLEYVPRFGGSAIEWVDDELLCLQLPNGRFWHAQSILLNWDGELVGTCEEHE